MARSLEPINAYGTAIIRLFLEFSKLQLRCPESFVIIIHQMELFLMRLILGFHCVQHLSVPAVSSGLIC